MRAQEIMSSPVVTASPSTTLKDIARLMLQHDIGAVPIVDDQGHLAGIVTEDDILPVQSGLQVLIVSVPLMQRIFATAWLSPSEWLLVAVAGIWPVLVINLLTRRRAGAKTS